jgi:hypothetical protein
MSINFSEKIKVTHAQKGYFIAKRFGKYAVAQAKKDEKIELLVASTELDTLPPLITTFHFVYDTISGGDIAARSTQSVFQKVGTRTFPNESSVTFKGEGLLLSEFKERILKSIESEVMSHVPTGTFSEGVYKYDKTQTLTYQPEKLYIDGVEILELDVQALWEAQIFRPMIVSTFDIKTHGRVVTQEFDNLPPGVELKASFINVY